jgi:hypothetical protein
LGALDLDLDLVFHGGEKTDLELTRL